MVKSLSVKREEGQESSGEQSLKMCGALCGQLAVRVLLRDVSRTIGSSVDLVDLFSQIGKAYAMNSLTFHKNP